MVIWLIGLSGSGKSTLGRILTEHLRGLGRRSCLVDGDQARDFFDRDLGYGAEARRENVKRIAWAAYLLSANGVDAVVANISPFEDLREFHRRKIPGYLEVYLRRGAADCAAADVKGVYAAHRENLVGVDVAFEAPRRPDLVLDTGGEPVERSFARLARLVEQRLERLA